MAINSSLQMSIAVVQAFLTRNFCAVKNWPKICVSGRKCGRNVKFCFRQPQKNTSLHETTSFDVLIVKIDAGVLAVG